jgi:hypothetical protein
MEEVSFGHNLSHSALSMSTVSFEYTMEADFGMRKPSRSSFILNIKCGQLTWHTKKSLEIY